MAGRGGRRQSGTVTGRNCVESRVWRRAAGRGLEAPAVTIHGGDVWQVSEERGFPASELLDFSANINPRGLPPRARRRLERDASDARLLSFYPDPSARRLREALSQQLA